MRMQVEEVKPTPVGKKVLAVVLAVLAVAALGWGGYKAWLSFSVPAMPQTVEDVEQLLDDPRYQNMSAQDRRPYVEHVNEMLGALSSDDRRRLRESFRGRDDETARQAQMDMGVQMLRTFHGTIAAAETPQQQDQVLDGMIAMMDSQQGRPGGGEGGARPSSDNGESYDEPSAEERQQGERMMANFLDSGDPQAIGYVSELFKLIEERRQERGMAPMGSE